MNAYDEQNKKNITRRVVTNSKNIKKEYENETLAILNIYWFGIFVGCLVLGYYLYQSIFATGSFELTILVPGISEASKIWILSGILKIGSEILEYLVKIKRYN